MMSRLPYELDDVTDTTIPAVAARIGLPHDAPKSVPSWSFQTPVIGWRRIPYGDVTGPVAGMTRANPVAAPTNPAPVAVCGTGDADAGSADRDGGRIRRGRDRGGSCHAGDR